MRMGKRGVFSNKIGYNFPLRAPGMINDIQLFQNIVELFEGYKKSETSDEELDSEGLLLGVMRKRKPGMEFLGKRL